MPFYPDLDLTGPCPLCDAEPGELCVNVINGRDIAQRVHRTRVRAAEEAKAAR